MSNNFKRCPIHLSKGGKNFSRGGFAPPGYGPDGVSRLGLDLETGDPFLPVSGSKVSGHVSVSKDTGLETLIITKKWYSKISMIQ